MLNEKNNGNDGQFVKQGCLRWCWLALVVIVLDQLTKFLAVKFLVLYQPKPILPFLNFTLMFNKGAAFSFLSNTGSLAIWLFGAIAILVSVIIVQLLYRMPVAQRWLACAYALVLGGALGNVIDRFAIGHVIDFIDFYLGNWHFATFNVADAAISIGAVIWFLDLLLIGRQQKP